MRKARRLYYGPATLVAVHVPQQDSPEFFPIGPKESVLSYRVEGLPESDIIVLERLIPAMAQIDLPDWPVEKMDDAVLAFTEAMEILRGGFSANKISKLVAIFKAMSRLLGR